MPIHQAPDANLAALAGLSYFIGFDVILYMPWGVASGSTTAYNDYYRHLAAHARGGNLPADAPEGIADVIDRFAKNNFDRYAEVPYSETAELCFREGFDLTLFVILKNAVCSVGGIAQPLRHDYLRLRLADVTAWAFGTFD